MPVIQQLSPHIANLIAAGEVVERPASVIKELLENAIDAGADKISIEIQNGGMTFLRVTDNGCGMEPTDARTAFLRHATSKLRKAEDLAAIGTMGFRGEALAAIASVSRIDLMTKPRGALSGTSLHLEGGTVTEESEIGCPEGTTIIIRDLFFNTPARMKFMKSDTVEGSRVTAAVQLQALAHPQAAITLIRDGKQVISTPGKGGLQAAVYAIHGRECAGMIPVDSTWDGYHLTGFVTKPTDSRPTRNLQTFFVNSRPVKSRLLVAALEEAYRNQIMVGKFPGCVLHLELPAMAVDVNVHPAKTEVKFLNEKTTFDCIHYGVLAALNKTQDRPQMHFQSGSQKPAAPAKAIQQEPKKDFFRTMNAEEYKTFSKALADAPKPKQEQAAAVLAKLPEMPQTPKVQTAPQPPRLQETVMLPRASSVPPVLPPVPKPAPRQEEMEVLWQAPAPSAAAVPAIPKKTPTAELPPIVEAEQLSIPIPEEIPWRMVGELYKSYILVEQGEDAFLIDKHAAHERILFEKLKAHQEQIVSQSLLAPMSLHLSPAAAGVLMDNAKLLEELGFEIEEFGENTILLRKIPMDLGMDQAAETIELLSADLLSGKQLHKDTMRDEMLHTVACKAAIKAGWNNAPEELLAVVRQVMSREDLKYCPHGRPICISLSKKQLEKQFKRT